MRLDQVIERSLVGSELLVEVVGDAMVEVTSATMDSRAVVAGSLFACVPGRQADGHAFAAAAVRAGASALLCERPLDVAAAQVVVRSTRQAIGPVASVVYGDPSRSLLVAGVTGTNGKTTTCALLAEIFRAHGWAATAVGTLTQTRTTPEAPELQALLAELRDEGQRAVAMEVSSHALDQHRVEGVEFAAGIFTNMTHDHLDYHGTMERYFDAKARLFEGGRSRLAIVNRDDEWGRKLIERLEASGTRAETFGIDDAEELDLSPAGTRFRWEGIDIDLRLGGRFNVLNALGAARGARALGIERETIAAGLASVARVRGRFEAVDAGQDFTVLVDYAHTPDGLGQALAAARELTRGRLVVVFGAGGDRDHEKRPLMGEVAARLADLAVVTSDNPRSEDPGAIIESVVAGAADPGKVKVMPDRATAIDTAMRIAQPGDVVLIAGKGHEAGQEVAGQFRPFDDAAVARETIAGMLDAR